MTDVGFELKVLIISCLSGGGIGLFHFGGLWWTVRRMNHVRNPAYEFIFSFFLRTGISIGLFYFISDGRWDKILAALAGFLAVRYVMVRKIGVIPNSTVSRTEDKIHGY
jgi:F1F0 ATPase subunit 2